MYECSTAPTSRDLLRLLASHRWTLLGRTTSTYPGRATFLGAFLVGWFGPSPLPGFQWQIKVYRDPLLNMELIWINPCGDYWGQRNGWCFFVYIYILHTWNPFFSSIFGLQPSKTRPKLQQKQGSFGFQVDIYIYMLAPPPRPMFWHCGEGDKTNTTKTCACNFKCWK